MTPTAQSPTKADKLARPVAGDPGDFGQTVLVLQGGGALGAYQVGVYQALHEAGIEPAWVIGTSIGAINGAIIAGNRPEDRLARLTQFWDLMQGQRENGVGALLASVSPGVAREFANTSIYTKGIDGFFVPNPQATWGINTPLGAESAAFYSTAPLHDTLLELTNFDYINAKHGRLTLGAVNVKSGAMHYFDSRDQVLSAKHVMASGALPPAFPAVRIDGETYWDGGIYSNTPIEVVLDDKPRRNSLIFSANVWHPTGPEPDTIRQVLGRQKDIQFASRVNSHVARQQQIHRLRHIIRDLAQHLPAARRDDPEVKKLTGYGCATVMHVVPLLAPRIEGEDHTKDIDFTAAGIKARRAAGYADTRHALEQAPWQHEIDAMDGIIIHEIRP
jgi:NTE family protein